MKSMDPEGATHFLVQDESKDPSQDANDEEKDFDDNATDNSMPSLLYATAITEEDTVQDIQKTVTSLDEDTVSSNKRDCCGEPPLLIWEAIPLYHNNKINLALSFTDISLLGSCEEDDTPVEDSRSEESETTIKFQIWAFCCGLVIGGFIQLSSLGCNYLLSELYPVDTTSGTEALDNFRNSILSFTLCWSIVTSFMGVSILLLIRSLMVLQQPGQKQKLDVVQDFFPQLECSFAIGTLLGLCIVCILTDVFLLDSTAETHLGHSLWTFVVALVWCKLLYVCTAARQKKQQNTDDQVEAMTKPLLQPAHGGDFDDKRQCSYFWFRFASCLLGLLVGFFTQLSSLGANFLLAHWNITPSSQGVFGISFVWALLTSLMGILVMVLVRGLLKLTATSTPLKDATMHLECNFAFGALFGVNVAWMTTDFILGMRIHYFHSIVTLAIALIWCRMVSWCVKRNHHHDDRQAHNDDRLVLLV
jgi:hypothetical protein